MDRLIKSAGLIAVAVISVIMIAAVSSCSSSRYMTTKTSEDFNEMTLKDRFASLVASGGQWKEMNIPLKIEISSPAKMSVSARAYMRRGKDIYLSFRFLGMEVANLYITADSIFGTDKINNRYVAEEVRSVLAGASVSVSDIQDLLTGRIFINGEGELTPAAVSIVDLTENCRCWSATPKKKIHGAGYRFDIDNATNILRSLTITAGSNDVIIGYSSETDTDAGQFMAKTRITANVKDKNIDARLNWNFQKVKWHVDDAVGWRKPRGYTRVNAVSLLKLVSSAR